MTHLTASKQLMSIFSKHIQIFVANMRPRSTRKKYKRKNSLSGQDLSLVIHDHTTCASIHFHTKNIYTKIVPVTRECCLSVSVLRNTKSCPKQYLSTDTSCLWYLLSHQRPRSVGRNRISANQEPQTFNMYYESPQKISKKKKLSRLHLFFCI